LLGACGTATALQLTSASQIPWISARFCVGIALALLTLGFTAAYANAGTYGSTPVSISAGIGGKAPNGASSDPAVSGDNRSVRIVAYSSLASNLVPGDDNGVSDIFAWHRPLHAVPRAAITKEEE